jgi:hypothetical protein
MKPAAPNELPRSEKNFWTVKDAARYLGVSVETIYGWVSPESKSRPAKIPGPLPPIYRFGKRHAIRIPIKEFLVWVENFRQGAN